MEKRKFYAGLFLIIALMATCIWLFVYTDANFKTPHYIFFYSCVSLICGLGFFILSESTGTFSSKSLGIKLTGAAGIGASIIFLLHNLLPLKEQNDLVGYKFQEFHSVKFDLSGEEIRQLNCREDRYIMEFTDDSESIELNAQAISKRDGKIKEVSVTLFRNGGYEYE